MHVGQLQDAGSITAFGPRLAGMSALIILEHLHDPRALPCPSSWRPALPQHGHTSARNK